MSTMGGMMQRVRSAVVIGSLCVVALTLGCTRTALPVKWSDAWPKEAIAYDDAYHQWTRHAQVHTAEWDLAFDGYATLKTVDWRAAWS